MKAVVCGAGIAGLTTAWWLARSGWEVTVVEQAPGPRGAGYMIDFFGPGFEVARRMGLVPALRSAGAHIAGVDYTTPDGRPAGSIAYHRLAAALDDEVICLPRGHLAGTLLDAVRDSVELRWGVTVVATADHAGGVDVRLSDGSVVAADLLVGADGLRSQTRDRLVAPAASALRPLGFHTAAFLLQDADLARLVHGRMLVVAAPGRQVALYPMSGNEVAAWLVHHERGPERPADTHAAVRSSYRGLGPVAERALAHCTDGTDLYYDVVAQVEVQPWFRGRAVLVGDACQAPSLMAGQGASMAMAGAWALAHQLGRHDVDAAVREYARTMRPFAQRRQQRGRRTARWLVPAGRLGIAVRAAALTLLRPSAATPLLSRAFTAEATDGLAELESASVGTVTPRSRATAGPC